MENRLRRRVKFLLTQFVRLWFCSQPVRNLAQVEALWEEARCCAKGIFAQTMQRHYSRLRPGGDRKAHKRKKRRRFYRVQSSCLLAS